jgi:hypothetical protein
MQVTGQQMAQGTRRYFAANPFIQQREAYFDYTAAPGDNCAAHAHAEQPSCALPASLVQLHWPEMAGGAG